MIQLIMWLAVLIFLLLMSYKLSGSDILAPEFCYVICFIPQALQAFYYIEKWKINLDFRTLCILVGGTSLFVLMSILVSGIYSIFKKQHIVGYQSVSEKHAAIKGVYNCHIDSWKLVAFLVFQIIICVLLINILISTFGTSLQKAIYYYRAQGLIGYRKADVVLKMPMLLERMRQLSICSGFIWAYLLAQRWVTKEKDNNRLIFLNLGLSLVNSYISTGGRKGIFQYIVVLVLCYYILNGIDRGWRRKVKVKSILLLIFITAIAILMFKQMGIFAGRNINRDFNDYLAMYLCAPLKNLDIAVVRNNFGISDISQATVFKNINSFLHRIDLTEAYVSAHTYNYVNGINIGNAYTAYYSYLHDFGYAGLVIFVSIKAVICQLFYQHIKWQKFSKDISILMIMYAYLFYNLIFSFFSNFFVTAFFDTELIIYLIMWVLLKWFLSDRVRVKGLNFKFVVCNRSWHSYKERKLE